MEDTNADKSQMICWCKTLILMTSKVNGTHFMKVNPNTLREDVLLGTSKDFNQLILTWKRD